MTPKMSHAKKDPSKQDRPSPALALANGSLSDAEMAELAEKIANDINEGIDCRETRATLREVVRWWSMQHCVTASELALRKSDIVVGKLAVQLLLRVLKRSKSKHANAAREVAEYFLKANIGHEPRRT